MLSPLTVLVSLVTRKAAFEELVVAESEPRKLALEGERPVVDQEIRRRERRILR